MKVDYFSLPLSEPLQTAKGPIEDREGYLVTVEEPDIGLGEATPLPGWTESLAACKEALESGDPLDELPPAARHGVSLAALDAQAKSEGEPLYRFLGGQSAVESVPVNATVGDADPETTAKQVTAAVDAGFPAVKLKVGARSIEEDIERVAAVRDAAPDAELRLDANGAWTRAEAQEAFDALTSYGIAYVEQPLPADDLDGHAALRETVPVALDEGLYEHGFDAVLDANAADVWILKPMAMGGPDVAIEAAGLARGAGIAPVVTTTIDGCVARAAAVHVAAAIPDVRACGLATGSLLSVDFGPDPVPVSNGRIAVPQKEGNIPTTSSADYA
ncbi:mandelate racemase/muconate lactonizing enzyme family protein [Natronomonas sp. EA1]|uniref:mandelate racemase/muconate lactonizing enzyme family protein n=1 Tax=Natronomonas sp. EA1 TaxID=3421655 RepID=UPI003EBC3AC6